MENLKRRLAELFFVHSELSILRQLMTQKNINCWLVGGTIRDLLLNRPVLDIDIAADSDPSELARIWAQAFKGHWFWLDPERKQSRVLLANQLTVDFSPLRAATIAEDQKLRDFTINSMAIPLGDNFPDAEILDPLDGMSHLQQKHLEFCSERSLPDDPLRMLKGVRHAVTLDMPVTEKLQQEIAVQAHLIGTVAGERIRDEISKILTSTEPVAGIKILIKSGLFAEIFGPASPGWEQKQTFKSLEKLNQQIQSLEGQTHAVTGIENSFNTRALFMLATFLRDYAPADLPDVLHERLRLSRQQQRIILSLQQEPDGEWFDQAVLVKTARQKALLTEQLGYFPDEQLYYWAVSKQLISLEKARELLDDYRQQQELGRVPDLLNGNQVRELLQGQPDEQIGAWQKKIKSAELTGEINSVIEARQWLLEKISD